MNRLKLLLFLVSFFAINSWGQNTNISTSDSPTEAYKRLFYAVKSKDTEAIKKAMSIKSIEFGQMASSRNGTTPPDKVYEHGFTATTFVDTLPMIRDERIKGNMGAVEVWNAKDDKWEDLPFILCDGVWKLAIGEMFSGTYNSPGKSQSMKELEAAPKQMKGPKNFPLPISKKPKPKS